MPNQPGGAEPGVYRDRRVLVTGHTGFKGSWLSLWLEALGAQVSGFALDPPTTPSLFELADVSRRIDDVRGDVRDLAALETRMRTAEPSIVFHLAAQPLVRRSYGEPKETFDVNVGGTTNVLEAARACPSVRAVVVVTSDKCYENMESERAYVETDPLGGRDPYSASKACTELVCSAYRRSFFEPSGIGLATARAGNVIGGGDWAEDRIVPDAVRAIEAGESVGVRSPDSVRPWQHVLDPLCGYLMVGERLLSSHGSASVSRYAGAFNFGPRAETTRSVRDLVTSLLEVYGRGDWRDISGGEQASSPEAKLLALDCAKAREILGWSPRFDFLTTLSRTARWYRRLGEGRSALELCLEDLAAFGSADG